MLFHDFETFSCKIVEVARRPEYIFTPLLHVWESSSEFHAEYLSPTFRAERTVVCKR